MITNIDIIVLNDYSLQCDVKVGGNIVNQTYFTRKLTKVTPNPTGNFIIVGLPGDSTTYMVTNNQSNSNDEIYIVDTVDGVAPTSLLDLALKIGTLIK
jgi:predicted peptidase